MAVAECWDDLEGLDTIDSEALAGEIVNAYEDARAGNPFPLIELQWGKILSAAEVLADPDIMHRQTGRYLILDDCQRDIIASTLDSSIREVYVKGNTGCGKGFALAICVCTYFATFDDARVVLTRDSYKPAVKTLFAEVARWWRRMLYPPARVELQAAGLVHLDHRQHAVAVASPLAEEGFMGAHGEHVLFVFDEATAPILEDRFKLADTQAKKFLALGNPRTTAGAFRRAFDLADDPDECQTVLGPYGLRRLITVDGADILNVRAKRLAKPVGPIGGIEINGRRFIHGETIPKDCFDLVREIIPGQTCYDEYLGHCANPNREWVLCMAHGKFPSEDPETQLIARKWLAEPKQLWTLVEAMRRRVLGRKTDTARRLFDRLFAVQAFGLDVAGSIGGDDSVLTAGGDKGIYAQHAVQLADATALSSWVIKTVRECYRLDLTHGLHPVCVDVDGIGWGVAGILRQSGVRVIEFRGNESSDVDPKRYLNKRAESYGELGNRLDPEDRWKGQTFLLPDDEMLSQELCAPEKLFKRDGLTFGITPKRRVPGVKDQGPTVYDKIGRSPDRGDSACYFFRALQAKGLSLETMLDAGLF